MIKTHVCNAYIYNSSEIDKMGYAHVCRVANYARTESERNVALCHDLLEDGYATSNQLKEWGLSEEEVCAVNYLTRDDAASYNDYIDSIIASAQEGKIGADLALQVKMYDLFDHLTLYGIHNITYVKAKRYIKALDKIAKSFCRRGKDDSTSS